MITLRGQMPSSASHAEQSLVPDQLVGGWTEIQVLLTVPFAIKKVKRTLSTK